MNFKRSVSKITTSNLKEAENTFFRIANNAKDMIYHMSLPDGKYLYVNNASIEIFGYNPEEFYHNPLLIKNAIHPDFYDYFRKEWVNLLNGNVNPEYEYKIIHKSGKICWLNQRNVLIKDKKGNPIAIEGVVSDVTERKRIEFEKERLNSKLKDRIKELNCLYSILELSLENLPLNELFCKIIKIIPSSFQFPEICAVKIEYNGKLYISNNYKKTKWFLKGSLDTEGNSGEIIINYIQKVSTKNKDVFLKEELDLFDGITMVLKKGIINRINELELLERNEELKEKNEEYAALNEEIKEKNEEFYTINEELEEEIERRADLQNQLLKQHDVYMAMFHNHPDILYVVDPETYEVLFVNDKFIQMLGENPVGGKCYEKFQGYEKPCDFCTNKILKKNNGKSYIGEYHNALLKKDFYITDQIIKWPDGRDVRFELAIDVTDIKKTEKELKEKTEEYFALNEEYKAQNEELLEKNNLFQELNAELKKIHNQQLALFNGIEDVIYVADPETYEVLYFNEAALGIWGKDAVGKKCYEALQGRDDPCPFCTNDKILGDNIGQPYVWEFQNGISKEWYRCADKAIKWSNGKYVRFELASNITDLKNIQTALIESEQEFRSIFENSPLGKSMTGIDGSLRVNKAFCNILGYSEEELKNKNWKELTHPDDIQQSADVVQSLLEGNKNTVHFEKRYIHKNGNIIYTDVNTTLLKSQDNSPRYFITSITDITDRKKDEKKLIEYADKLETLNEKLKSSNVELEQFAYVASHDLQEPLRKVKTFAELFAKKYKGKVDEKAERYINYITGGAERMQNLILDLLIFSRVSTRGKEFENTNLNQIVKQVKNNLQISINEQKASIISDKLPVVKADPTQMLQLFQNIISNSIKFKKEVNIIINIRVKDEKKYWLFEIIDNGIGLDMAYKNRIFEVFQRLHSKEEYKGTGIGLAICKKIIERHKGKIWVESRINEGATFYFKLPK